MQWNSLPTLSSSQPSQQPFCTLSNHISMGLSCPRHRKDASAMNAPDIEVNPLRIFHSCSSFYPLTRLSSVCGSDLERIWLLMPVGNSHEGSCVQVVIGEGTSVFWPECLSISDVTRDEAQTSRLRSPPSPLPHKVLRISTHWPLFSAADYFGLEHEIMQRLLWCVRRLFKQKETGK